MKKTTMTTGFPSLDYDSDPNVKQLSTGASSSFRHFERLEREWRRISTEKPSLRNCRARLVELCIG
jgi:hypothetical protein